MRRPYSHKRKGNRIFPTCARSDICAPTTFFHLCGVCHSTSSLSESEMAGKGDEAPCLAALRGRVRPLIDLADSLRKLGLQQDLPIPQIAVCGNQSSGKSSVLESISRVTFPRG